MMTTCHFCQPAEGQGPHRPPNISDLIAPQAPARPYRMHPRHEGTPWRDSLRDYFMAVRCVINDCRSNSSRPTDQADTCAPHHVLQSRKVIAPSLTGQLDMAAPGQIQLTGVRVDRAAENYTPVVRRPITMLCTWGRGRPWGLVWCSKEAITQCWGLTGENRVRPVPCMSSSTA
jgi:hypothetical protein